MVQVYTFEVCRYCDAAKNLLRSLSIRFQEILVHREDQLTRDELFHRTGMKTFPQIFFGEKVVGGYSELKALHESGELMKVLSENGGDGSAKTSATPVSPNSTASNVLSEMTERVRAFCEEREWDQFHTPKELAIGVTTEAAELLEMFRFKSENEISDLQKSETWRQQLSFEMSDVLFFLLRMSDRLQINLPEAFQAKMKLNSEKYPISKSKGSNKKYTEL